MASNKSFQQTELDEELIAAIGNHDLPAVCRALDWGADPNARDGLNWVVLAIACKEGRRDIFQSLVERGADPLVKDPAGAGCGNLLHWLASFGWSDWVGRLLAMRVDPDDESSQGVRPLHWAAAGGYIDTCRTLLDAGAKPDPSACRLGTLERLHYTPMHFAARSNHAGVCRLLAERGASLLATAAMGRTPLHVAAEYGSLDTCRELIALGASPSYAPSSLAYDWYLTPFQFAVENGQEEVARMFMLECGETLRQKSNGGKSMAQLARKHAGLYQRLLTCVRSERATQNILDSIEAAAPDPVALSTDGAQHLRPSMGAL